MTDEKAKELLSNLIGMVEDNQENDYDTALKIGIDAIESKKIIRCKDCRFWAKEKHSLQGRCFLEKGYPTGMYFCGSAQRKEQSK